MTITITKSELFEKVTHLQCELCSHVVSITVLNFAGVTQLDLEDDVTYDVWAELINCCDDPMLSALIISDVPLFGVEEIDGPRLMPEGPATAFNPRPRESDEWHYVLEDDLFDELEDAGVLNG